MRQLLRKLPGVWRIRRAINKTLRWYNRHFGARRFKRKLAISPKKQIVVGSSRRYDTGWIPTEIDFLNLLKPADWDRFFQRDSIDAILAEHVWEHLTPEEARSAAATCFKYLRPGGYLRVAVPDGLHPDPTYRQWVKVGGALPGQPGNDHKVLYTYRTLSELFKGCGFRVVLYEYFNEAGKFCYQEWDERGGKIHRSKRFEERNREGRLVFTSIVLDAFKDASWVESAGLKANVPGSVRSDLRFS
jgi:predicted SAM-dependent methyltransferase